MFVLSVRNDTNESYWSFFVRVFVFCPAISGTRYFEEFSNCYNRKMKFSLSDFVKKEKVNRSQASAVVIVIIVNIVVVVIKIVIIVVVIVIIIVVVIVVLIVVVTPVADR